MDTDALVVRRLMDAAARSGALLVTEAATLVDGWAVLADPVAGAVYSSPAGAGSDGVRAAASPESHPRLVMRPAAGALLVVGPGSGTAPRRTALVARTTAGLLEVRAQRADELRGPEMRLHTAVLRLLLRGETSLVTEVLGLTATHATVYRLTGRDVQAAHQVLWRAVMPTRGRNNVRGRVLVGLLDTELAVASLHDLSGDEGRALRLIARVADRHGLLGGVADPVPLDMVATAWADAGSARAEAAPGRRLAPATGMGEHGLLRILPADRLAAWAREVLQPLDRAQRRTLEIWLRSGSVQTIAPLLGASEKTVRARLRDIGRLLDADLDRATVQAHLLLALRAPTPADAPATGGAPSGAYSFRPPPATLIDPAEAHQWASGLAGGLETPLRIALRCWLKHRGKVAPAAAELGLHRTTLTQWLEQCADDLGLDLSSATVRAELHLALETIATPTDVPSALPRRGGRTYR
ncbi:helix-turn-helix domain-containing protein [Streptomyces niveus]|uniref:helix-turn-helix domain-containing protein n=1 Tax=Streptomyces niveus TaxID=193462 RepID=UPI0035DE286A